MKSVTLRKALTRLKTAGMGSAARRAWWNVSGFPQAMVNVRRREFFSDLDDVIRFTFTTANGFIKPIQIPWEIDGLLRILKPRQPRRLLEIGTANGGTLYLLTRVAADDAHLVSIDLPCGDFGGGYPRWKVPLYRSFARPGQRLDLVRADSHAKQTQDRVKAIFGGYLLDFIFIDADHSYEGVKRDFEMYQPLLSPGGVMAFHDIANNPDPAYGVHRFWNEIKTDFDHREFVHGLRGQFGIGVLWMP